jgi:hypothetical protein
MLDIYSLAFRGQKVAKWFGNRVDFKKRPPNTQRDSLPKFQKTTGLCLFLINQSVD